MTEDRSEQDEIMTELRAIRKKSAEEYYTDPEKFTAGIMEQYLLNPTAYSRADGTRFETAEELKHYIENN